MAAHSVRIPAPYILRPTLNWDGNDGNWSTFHISIGDDGQDFRVLISTKGNAAFVPIPGACNTSASPGCPDSRGIQLFHGQNSTGFQSDKSGTWKEIGIFGLKLEDKFGDDARGSFGLDKIRLGADHDTDSVWLDGGPVVGYQDDSYYMGMLGLSNSKSILPSGPFPNLIQKLKDDYRIPSLSYGYTAGAIYRNKKVAGSLVLGGYDQSRFEPAEHNFTIAAGDDRQLIIGVQSISTSGTLDSPLGPMTLDMEGHDSAIDSTVSHLWLPQDVCKQFEKAFGLAYDEQSQYYLISDELHNNLTTLNATLTFNFVNQLNKDGKNFTSITLPYAAFDVTITDPEGNTNRVFPIRRSQNQAQNTVGRLLLQEAYLIVDYESNTFNLSRALFPDPLPDPDIRTILPEGLRVESGDHGFSAGAKAGISVGVIAAVALALGAVYLYWWRPKRQREKPRGSSVGSLPPYTDRPKQPNEHYMPHDAKPGTPLVEMPVDNEATRPELEGTHQISYELAATQATPEVYEVEANAPRVANAPREANVSSGSNTTAGASSVGGASAANERSVGGEQRQRSSGAVSPVS